MTNTERLEMAARKMLVLAAGALEKLVTFEVLEMADGRKVMAICFNVKDWEFDGKVLKLKPKS